MSSKPQVAVRLDAEAEEMWERLKTTNPSLTQLELLRLALQAAEHAAETVKHPELGELQAMWSRIAAVVTGINARDIERQTTVESERKAAAEKYRAVESERDALKKAEAEAVKALAETKEALKKADTERELHLQRLVALDAKLPQLEAKAAESDALRGQVESLKTQVQAHEKTTAQLEKRERDVEELRADLQKETVRASQAEKNLAVKTTEAAECEKRLAAEQEHYKKLEARNNELTQDVVRLAASSKTETATPTETPPKKDKK